MIGRPVKDKGAYFIETKYYYKKYLFNISAQPSDNAEAAAPVKNWGGCDLYFLIIEYKTEENISAV